MSTIQKYGRFNHQQHCFELTEEPPRKWVNLHYNKIGDNEMYSEISNIGDGFTWCRDAAGRTCVLVNYDNKYLYIRDDETNTVFCPWGQPAPQQVRDKLCRYWHAKTEISGTAAQLKATQRIFVPAQHTMEVWTVTVENLSDRPREVSLFGYAMFQLTGCDHEGRGVWKDNFGEVHPEIQGVMVTNRNVDVPSERFKGFLVTTANYSGASAYRDNFTRSDFGYGTPKILWGWNADNKPGYGPDCAGIVQVRLHIPPHSSARADFLLGQCSNVQEVKSILDATTPAIIDRWCDEQMQREEQKAAMFTIESGNPDYDGMFNFFLKKQLYSYLINKSGFRDNMQVDTAIALFDLPAAQDNLLRALASQYPNGSVPHSFRPLNRLQYSDKPAWIMLTVPALVYERGDLGILDKVVPYFESEEQGSVWDHMLRAMRFLASDVGVNGLCNQHHADWNDGLEATKEAGERESVMVTQQLCYGLLQVQKLAGYRGDSAVAQEAAALYQTFKERLNSRAWDGEWYVRTICADGYRIGSKTNEEGSIFLNTQSWAILSETADEKRAARCMGSVDERLEEDLGFRICTPSFSRYDARVGRMSNSMPGQSENGGCYCHAAGFKGVADCMMGRAEEAWRTFVKVAPDNPENPVEQSQMEPFSFTNSFSKVEHIYGRAGYPWRTGTAAWMTVLLIEWILGARRSMEGLLIDPCMSASLKQVRLTRTFRGAVYAIELDNREGRCTGAREIWVDGTKIEGNVLPDFRSGRHEVKVII